MTPDNPDHVALAECMRLAMRDPATKRQLESMLEDRDWFTVASFACYCVQGQTLGLRPWEGPPVAVSDNFADEHVSQHKAVKLPRRMLAAGLSRYEPSPLRALKQRQRVPTRV